MSNPENKEQVDEPEVLDQIEFHYMKSPQFRTVHMDGAIGGITPAGNVHFAVYNERTPIPRSVVSELGSDGAVGKSLSISGLGGIHRELEIDLVMTPSVAKQLAEFLLRQAIEQAEVTSSEEPEGE